MGLNIKRLSITWRKIDTEQFRSDVKMKYIKKNAWVTVNIDVFVTSEVIRHYFSRVTKSRVKIIVESPHEWHKSLFTITKVLIYFLHAILCPGHTILLKTIIDCWFRHCGYGRPFSDLALWRHHSWNVWRHANVGYWHCDAIFVDYSCRRKFEQRRSSQVNNNREYRFLATRFTRLSV